MDEKKGPKKSCHDNQPLTPNFDTDAEMANEHGSPEPAPLTEPPTHTSGTCPPSMGFTIHILGLVSYANALKQSAEQAGNRSSEGPDNSNEQGNSKEVDNPESNLHWPLGSLSGPIKGFCAERIMENLDPHVRCAWEGATQEAIFVHYLDGGYNPNIAQNIHAITEDLKSEYHLRWQHPEKNSPT